MADVDVSEVDALARDLEREARVMPADAAKIVKRGAVQVKNAARRNASGHSRAPRLPWSIGFDVEGDGLEAVIGPDKDSGSGPLATFYEYGSANDAPQPFLAPALDEEAPRFEKALRDAMLERWWRS
jgi:HK97 gp10 family phage protein